MALREILVNGKPLLVEVSPLEQEGGGNAVPAARARGRHEYTDARGERSGGEHDLADRIRDLVAVVTAPVQAAFEGSGAAEWTLEVNVGFKGETGLPFVAKGEANAAVKVSAKWVRRP